MSDTVRIELRAELLDAQAQVAAVFEDPAFRQTPYYLHSVLVHAGHAEEGHYWAFIYNPEQGVWFKFNDMSVSQVDEELVWRESVGGHLNASAYCLFYLDARSNRGWPSPQRLALIMPPELIVCLSIVILTCWNSVLYSKLSKLTTADIAWTWTSTRLGRRPSSAK